jgi:hypothetical protein
MRQHSNPFQNLAEHGVRRAQANALLVMMPSLAPLAKLPCVSEDLGDGYILLGPRDEYRHAISAYEAVALHNFYNTFNIQVAAEQIRLCRWARLRLPNEQIVRTAWKEKPKALTRVRISRNVMV